jgi:hypothetical protein
MQRKIIWQQNSGKSDNAENLATIRQWWKSLANKDVQLAQRLISQTGEVDELNWELQRFDEKFEIQNPEIRGITLYWSKPDSTQERSTTPSQLVLDTRQQHLYIFPQSQPQVVMRVTLPQVVYETIELKNPQIEFSSDGQKHLLILRDTQEKIEVKASINWTEFLNKIKQQLPG